MRQKTGHDYIRVTVILASVLFIVGISSHFPASGIRIGLAGPSAASSTRPVLGRPALDSDRLHLRARGESNEQDPHASYIGDLQDGPRLCSTPSFATSATALLPTRAAEVAQRARDARLKGAPEDDPSASSTASSRTASP